MSYTAQPKDHQRVANLYGRAVGKPYDKVLQLAQMMASAIKDPAKACRRGDAAWHFAWHGMPANLHEEVAELFYDRARALGSEAAVGLWQAKLEGRVDVAVAALKPAPAAVATPTRSNNLGKRNIQLSR